MSSPDFTLDDRLAATSVPVTELPLCGVRLMDDARYPWLLLVPRVAGVVEILDLDEADQRRLYDEALRCARALRAVVRPDKLNIAALGNQVPQLHLHVIARFHGDDAWPRPVWGAHPVKRYDGTARERLVAELATTIERA